VALGQILLQVGPTSVFPFQSSLSEAGTISTFEVSVPRHSRRSYPVPTVILFYFYFLSSLALQPCVSWPPPWSYSIGSGGFVTVNSSGMGSLSPRPTPNMEDQRLHFVFSLPFDLSGMGGTIRSLRSRQHSSPGHWGAQTSSSRQGGSPRGEYYLFILLV
jgi:hypothetical protein